MENNFCVYFHINPIKNHIFYVGIGNEKRPYNTSYGQRNSFWSKVRHKYGLIVDVAEHNLTWNEACEREKFYINKIGRRDLHKGTLVNLTDGGEGTPNLPKETRDRISKTKKGKPSLKIIDLSGKKFGKLTVIKKANRNKDEVCWVCYCECGNEYFVANGERIRGGITKSCGCIAKEALNNGNNKAVLQLDKKTGVPLSAFISASKASKLTNIGLRSIYAAIQNRGSKHSAGYNWKVISKEEYEKHETIKNISSNKFIKYVPLKKHL